MLEGYEFFGMDDARRAIEDLIAPVAERETEWRESLRDGSIDQFMDSYIASELPSLDHLAPDSERIRAAYVREHLALFDT